MILIPIGLVGGARNWISIMKPKEKPATYSIIDLKLNLSNKKSNKVPDPKNPGQTISQQSLDLRDRNPYTGELLKKN